MPTSSSSSSVHHLAPYSRRRSPRFSASAASEKPPPGKAATESSRGGATGVTGIMGPQQDPSSKDVPNGPTPKTEKVVVRYRECRKNHAASIGGYAVDGCREFMASGEEGTSAALKCAACSCHRSFHKREVESEVSCDCSSDSASSRR
ncbi:hypothetical protein Taro_010221 [Colocasia esculenta]|uniref:ZF-HD dimerization-type domain-containing protein n=1 Tax=Colocasia esculenta TaxID=4460 RepID=A0A843U8V1_COLES|nr:hypothetical protein [Colocasia esculenta]